MTKTSTWPICRPAARQDRPKRLGRLIERCAGVSGSSGTAGSGASGSAGISGQGGASGSAGTGGTNGTAGSGGSSGNAGSGGTAGTGGTSGAGGTGGAAGVGGSAGAGGSAGNGGSGGSGGTGGVAGSSGMSGASGSAGTGGTAGAAGSAGTGGLGGTSGTGGTGGVGGTGGTGGGAAGTPGCNTEVTLYPVVASPHVTTCSAVSYTSDPPTSGPHYPIWAAFKTYSSPVPRGFLVHDPEHGGVVFSYNCPGGCDADIATLQSYLATLPADLLCVAPLTRRFVITPDLFDASICGGRMGRAACLRLFRYRGVG
ncbi:MAG: DUF3105 domain-containing protein [Polyangiaceae bacterium]